MRARLTKVRPIDLKKDAAQKKSAEDIKTNKQADRIVVLIYILLGIICLILGSIYGFRKYRWDNP